VGVCLIQKNNQVSSEEVLCAIQNFMIYMIKARSLLLWCSINHPEYAKDQSAYY
jgi:hypothetical protein